MGHDRSSDSKAQPLPSGQASLDDAPRSSGETSPESLEEGLLALRKQKQEASPAPSDPAGAQMQCASCQAPLPQEASFCEYCGTPIDPLLGRTLGGKYLLRKKLGEGGFGAVYEAEEARLKRKVAVKTLHRHLSENKQVVARFQQEGIAASRLEHPNIVKIYDIGRTEDGYLWMAMEFLTGQSLDQLLKERTKIPPGEIMELMGPICEALAEAHQKGVIHRDIKPPNIMLVHVGGRKVPKVLDFGISRVADSDSQTATGMVMGTPQYMAPEQWESASHVTAASDVYSLGVMLYRMLAGRLPFSAESSRAWMRAHCLEPPAPLAPLLGADASSEPLAAAVMKALAKDPKDRYPTALELKQALEHALAPGGPTALRVPASGPLPSPIASDAPLGPATCARCDQDHAKGSPECPAYRVGRIVAGKYRVLRLMGAGGMGAVYEAEHLSLQKRVALKMLHPRFARNEVVNRRFEEEARRASSLKHPGIIDVSDLGRDADGSTYMEMEILSGQSVSDLLRAGPLPLPQALAIAREALEALAFAHEKGIVHRDLKPDNIFYAKDASGQMHAKILDFGIAKALEESDQQLTQTGSIMGTPYYMSPEQAADSKRVDARSDIYSMGATLFEMLTGKRPVAGQTINEILLRLIEDRVDKNPRKHRPEVPDWLDTLVARTMAQNPEERPQSARELASALREERVDTSLPTRPLSPESPPKAVAPTQPDLETAKPGEAESGETRGWGRFLALGAVGLLGAAALVYALWPPPPGDTGETKAAPPAPVSASNEATPPAPVVCAPLDAPDWREGSGRAVAGPGESGERLCRRALLMAKEDAIRKALCLPDDAPVTRSAPPAPPACQDALFETLRVLSWKAQIVGEDQVTTSTKSEGGEKLCEARGRFRVAPLPEANGCRFSIGSVYEEMKAWKKGEDSNEYRFRLAPDSPRAESDLYLITLLPEGEMFPYWDTTGKQKIQGKLIDPDGKATPFTEDRHIPLRAGMESVAYTRYQLLPGMRESCEVLLGLALPPGAPFHVALPSGKGDESQRIGDLFSQLAESVGGLEKTCFTFQPYRITP